MLIIFKLNIIRNKFYHFKYFYNKKYFKLYPIIVLILHSLIHIFFYKKYKDSSSIYEWKLGNLKFSKEYDDISTEVSQLRFINN